MSVNIVKAQLPDDSVLARSRYDYADSYKGTVSHPQKQLTTEELAKAFFTAGPKWIGALFNLRNKVVAVFGLKTSGKKEDNTKQVNDFQCEPGDQVGLFKVFHKLSNEIILGEDDSHLNFRVSLHVKELMPGDPGRQLTISTVVEFHNLYGRLYFWPVKPFHKLIVPTILKGIINELNVPKESE